MDDFLPMPVVYIVKIVEDNFVARSFVYLLCSFFFFVFFVFVDRFLHDQDFHKLYTFVKDQLRISYM